MRYSEMKVSPLTGSVTISECGGGGSGGDATVGGSDEDESSLAADLQDGFCKINPVTKIGQRLYMIHMLLLPFLPIAALIIQNATTLMDLLQYQKEVESSGVKVDGATHLEKFITNMQRERSEVAFYIFTYGKQTLGLNLSERFKITDEALEKMPWPQMKVSEENEKMFKSKLRFQIRHGDFRQRISQDEEDINSILNWYNSADAIFLQHLSTGIKTTNSSAVWRYLIAYANLLRCIENLGIAVAYGIRYYGQGRITHDNYIQFIRHFTLGDEYLEQSQNYVPQVKAEYDVIKDKGGHYSTLILSKKDVLDQVERDASTSEALKFYQATYGYTEDLRVVIQDLRLRIKGIVDAELVTANQQQAFGVAILILVLIISPVIIFLVRNATVTIQVFSLSLSKKAKELKMEKKKADMLLFQILPQQVAIDLTSKRKVNAELIESVTLLMSNVMGFKEYANLNSPGDTVVMLNMLYKLYDCRMDKYEVYRLETVNDAFLIASGIPSKVGKQLGNKHGAEIATLALDIMAASSSFVIPNQPKDKLQLRIGIHTGPVVAGVQTVGNRLPRYRLFGESVNIVSTLNQTGEPMRIHISVEGKLLLDTLGGFNFEKCGMIEMKGKGLIETFWLTDKDGVVFGDGRDTIEYLSNDNPEYIENLSKYLSMQS